MEDHSQSSVYGPRSFVQKVSTTMYAPNLGELQSILIGATRCLDCRDPRCMKMCPENVDVRAAMRLIVGRGPGARPSSWAQQSEDAAASARDAIQSSFERF